MDTPVQKALRLLAALEDLAGQESACMRNRAFVEAVAATERSAPLVRALVELADDEGVLALRPRVQTLLDRRRESASLLDAHLARLQSEMRRVDAARTRLTRIAPVYLRGVTSLRSSLNAAV